MTRARGQKRRAVERSLAAELSDLADECRAAGGDCSAIRACVGEQCRSLTALTPKDE